MDKKRIAQQIAMDANGIGKGGKGSAELEEGLGE